MVKNSLIACLMVLLVVTAYQWRQSEDREEITRAELQSVQRDKTNLQQQAEQQILYNTLHLIGEEYDRRIREHPIPVLCINTPKQQRMYPFQ